MMYRLIALNGAEAGLRWSVSSTPLTIGRDPSCEVRLTDSEVAARHAVVKTDGDSLHIRDLGSMNRILVNRHEVREARLKHGDTIEIGLTRLMVEALVQADVAANAPPARRGRRYASFAAAAAVAAIAALWLIAVGRERARATAATASRSLPNAVPRASDVPEIRDISPPPVAESAPPAAPVATATPREPELPAPRVVVAPPPDLTPISEEVRRLREDMARLREAVEDRTPRGPEAATAAAAPEDELLDRARAAVADGRWVEADQILTGLLALAPDRADALAERASLYERRGLLKRALDVWTRLADSAAAPDPLREQARAEMRRLRSLESVRRTAAPDVRIAEADPVKFQTPEDADELRAVHVRLERAPEAPPPDPDALALEVVFYDRDPATGAVRPSAAVPAQTVRLDGAWEDAAPRTLVAMYRVPRGARAGEAYHGFVARLRWHERVIDERRRPRDLAAPAAMLSEARAENRP